MKAGEWYVPEHGPTMDTGQVAVLSGLPECPDAQVWRGAVRLRIAGIIESDNERWLKAMVADLSGPTIYEQMEAEGWTR